MQENLAYLRISSVVMKIAAWIFLLFGLLGGVLIITGVVPAYPRYLGAILIIFYSFISFFIFLVGKLAGLIREIIKEIKKE
ncbi:MAG: hypothetical protein ABIG46_00630 [Candidatus Omnitrophota bacterium]|nr:hypothetical protein [Candidatus Omnitrophota bacterium]